MPELLLGIDVGSYSTKAVLTDLAGIELETLTVEHAMEFPRPGWAEHDADAVWWGDVVAVCRRLFDGGRYSGADVAAVGVSAVGPCLLPLDDAGRPLRKAILYGVDTRAKAEIDDLTEAIGPEAVIEHAGMAFTSQAVGPKILWLRRHEPEVWRRARRFTTASSYMTYRLTGEHVIDRHTASHFMPLFDIHSLQWSERYAHLVAPVETLPRLAWSDEPSGVVTPEAARATGLAAGTPVSAGTIDVMADAVGTGVTEPGALMLAYGSSTSFILILERPLPDRRVWMTAGAFEGSYALSAGMATSGSITRWLRDEFARDLPPETAYADLFAAADAVPAGSDGLLFLPYMSGERTPLNDPDARGVVAGLSLTHTRAHLFRAALEGVAFGVRHNLETFETIGASIERIVAVGGGTSGDTWLQIVSDVTGREQSVPEAGLGACAGSAFLAGMAAGELTSADLGSWQRPSRRIVPDPAKRATYDRAYGNFRALYDATADVVHDLVAGAA
ncbi:MAG TPA: FGGY-family carbohydrate kinase [Trueperaceae bacterium]|nr:FGGY-family carbohydrate kinase [Trueperaceae bacterium]